MSKTTTMTTEELIENFEFLSDWEERYGYLIEMGKAMPAMSESLKVEENIVRGCTSQVWMVVNRDDKQGFSFIADSDAHIVRGLIAILRVVYIGKDAQFIKDFDIKNYFEKLGLESHLSPNRRNGFFAMVDRIKILAVQA